MAEGEPAQRNERESEPVPSAAEQVRSFGERELRVQVPTEIRDAAFPTVMRGYSRDAVDAYIKRVNHVIAELEMSRSPRAAVRHALDRVAEDVSGVLERARVTADEIISSARKEAAESSARAGAEAAKLLVNSSDEADRTRAEAEEVLAKARGEAKEGLATARAEAEETLAQSRAEASERLQRSEKELSVLRELAETRMRDLQGATEAVWAERREMLDDIRGMAARLEGTAREAAARFPHREPGEQAEEGISEPEAAEPESGGVAATDTPTQTMPAAELQEGGDDEAPIQEGNDA